MGGTTLKFKIGDKVRILPSATSIGVAEDEVGKMGVITGYHSPDEIIVLMDKIRKENGYRIDWIVESSQIEPAIKVGQQLVFDFMQQS